MSLVSRFKDFFRTEKVLNDWGAIASAVNDREIWTEVRGVPSGDVFERPGITGTFGENDLTAPNEQEQRTAYRGRLSRLVQMRAQAIADAMCLAIPKRQISEHLFEDLDEMHPWKVFMRRPSPFLSRFDFWVDASQMRDMSKGAFGWLGRDKRGVVDSAFFIYPKFGEVNPVPNRLGGIARYIYHGGGGSNQEIRVEDMVWLHHRHPVTPYEGASILERAAYESDISLAQAIYSRDTTFEGMVPPAYVSMKPNITAKQAKEYGELFKHEYQDVTAKRKFLVMGGGAEIKALGISPDDLQFIESAQLNNQDLDVIFGFPPGMFKDTGVVANSREIRRHWLQNSIQYEVNEICSSLTHQLKVAFGAMDSDLMIVPPNVIPLDPLEQQRVREIELRSGQKSPNDFRLLDGLPGIEGGDNYWVQGGLQPLNMVMESEPMDNEPIEEEPA